MAGALIVTARLGPADFAWLDAQRRAHFPPERNQLAAHLTMFHALPPSSEEEARRALARIAASTPPPPAMIGGLMNLGGGVAYRVESPALDAVREAIAEHFHGSLTAQDSGGWRPHVTIQIKVPAREARDLLQALEANFVRRPLAITGLTLERYMGGPWQHIAAWPFRGRA